jgi:4-alpha-glucanotransferase
MDSCSKAPNNKMATLDKSEPTHRVPRLDERASGLLMHVTSLPGPHGNGDLGPEARRFADFLAAGGQSLWQMLPVAPCGYGNSPYSAQSAFAGNPLLIALEPLQAAGWLSESALAGAHELPEERVDYTAAERFRTRCLRMAFEHGRKDPSFTTFRDENRAWLADYALFRALKSAHGEVEWTCWQPEFRDRVPAALARAAHELADEIAYRSFEQWLFADQWRELRAYCHAKGVALIGDIPIFLAHDSADVWQHRELFHVDDSGMPTLVSGVPPDYFSATGQRWGNPLYRWDVLRDTGYRFWLDRMRTMFERFDVVRLDHFIGFLRFWEIPAKDETAVNGRWVDGPADDFFHALARDQGTLQLIAEDLGEVTPEVYALRDRFGLSGCKVLQFAFGTDPASHAFLPHNYTRRSVVYTGTHDNDTVVGWFRADEELAADEGATSNRSREQIEKERVAVLEYLGVRDGREIHWDMIRACMLSVANTAIFPMQDVLGLGSEARMNRPGRPAGNWEWRVAPGAADAGLAERLLVLTRRYERQPTGNRT